MHRVLTQSQTAGEGSSAEDWQFFAGVSPAMRSLEQAVNNVAGTGVPVLILGESGTGKRALARHIHQLSGPDEPFREFPCTAVVPDFFAHGENGNGARLLCSGTLLLTEIADLSSSCQLKLLQALLERAHNGDTASRLRMIASSHRNLEQEIHLGRFREDLYYRISGVCLRIPPLRHRREDIPPLTEYYLDYYARLFGRAKPSLSVATSRFFQEYTWPGNVRELENTAKTIVAVGDERVAMAALRSVGLDRHRHGVDGDSLSLKQASRAASRQAERELILKVLSRTRWNRKRAAQELQISYKALLYKLKQIGVEDELLGSEETL